MRSAEDKRPRDRKAPVGRQPELLVGNGCPNDQQQHTSPAAEQDASVAMPPESKGKGDRTEWQNNNENLRMQVALGVLGQERQSRNDQRQREAMHEAKRGQRDRGAVEPVARFRRILIHWSLPLCCRNGAIGWRAPRKTETI